MIIVNLNNETPPYHTYASFLVSSEGRVEVLIHTWRFYPLFQQASYSTFASSSSTKGRKRFTAFEREAIYKI